MQNLPFSKEMIVDRMAEAIWRSYGAGHLVWENVHPYVQQKHRNDAIIAIEAAFPLICENIMMLCEELTEDSTVVNRVIDRLSFDFN